MRREGFPDGSSAKESTCNAGDTGSILGLGRSPEEGNGNPLQYFCCENPTDRGALWATVHGVVSMTEHARTVWQKNGVALVLTTEVAIYRACFDGSSGMLQIFPSPSSLSLVRDSHSADFLLENFGAQEKRWEGARYRHPISPLSSGSALWSVLACRHWYTFSGPKLSIWRQCFQVDRL